MRTAITLLSCSLLLWLCGCSHPEDAPKEQTAAEIQTQIDKAQNDPNMPDNVKSTVVANLNKAKAKAEQKASAH